MFRNRRKNESLPTSTNAAPSIFHIGNSSNNRGPILGHLPGSNVADGSGKAIRMEAPIAKAWKKAKGYTKGSYYALAICVFLIYFGYRFLRHHHCSIYLACHTEQCTLSISPQGWGKKQIVTFPRRQLLRAEAIKVDKDGTFVELSPRLDNFDDFPRKGKNKSGKQVSSYKGPDKKGHYPSYRIVLREGSRKPVNNEQTGDSVDGAAEPEIEDVKLTDLYAYLKKEENDEYSITIRQFGISQSRRRVKTTVQKIESYIKRRRHKLAAKESAPPAWQGIVMLVLGLFGLLLALLLGQFWEESSPNRRQSGPGTRNRSTPSSKRPVQYGKSAASRRSGY